MLIAQPMFLAGSGVKGHGDAGFAVCPTGEHGEELPIHFGAKEQGDSASARKPSQDSSQRKLVYIGESLFFFDDGEGGDPL